MGTFLDTCTTLLTSLFDALVDMFSCAWVEALFALVVIAFVISQFKRLT